MVDSWQNLTPKDRFNIQSSERLSNLDHQVLTSFYEPLIGTTGFALINLLWTTLQVQPAMSSFDHAFLLKTLNVDLPALYEARTKLEATGLVQTFVDTGSNPKVYQFKLIAPLAPQAFFKDDLLSVLLLDVIGEQAYSELADQYLPSVKIDSHAINISKSFFDVFSIATGKLTQQPKAITQVQSQMLAEQKEPVQAESATDADFDFEFLADILKKSYVDLKQLNEYRNLILTEHALYGLDETEIAKVITSATDISTNRFDAEKMKALVSEQFERTAMTVNAVENKASVQAPVEDSSDTAALTAPEQELVKAASAYDPIDFLQGIKQATGGFVTAGEQRILRQLVSRQLFSTATVNIMIYYILNDMKLPTLNKNLVDTMANDWSRSKVQTPQDALLEIHRHQENASSRGPRRNTPAKSVETLPDWAKEGYQPKASEQSLSKTELDELNQQLAELEKRNTEKGGQ